MGFLVGIILLLILLLILYWSNAFVFSNCANGKPCLAADYYNDPEEAIAAGYEAKDILFLGPQGTRLFYRRVPRVSGCTPGINQVIRVRYPPVCEFTSAGITKVGKKIRDGVYQLDDGTTIKAEQNCVPLERFLRGRPIIPTE